jgi:hypothetical protein
MLRRLEDRIEELCAKVIPVRGTGEFEPTIAELKAALHEQTERMRKSAALAAVNKTPPTDRRRSSSETAPINSRPRLDPRV